MSLDGFCAENHGRSSLCLSKMSCSTLTAPISLVALSVTPVPVSANTKEIGTLFVSVLTVSVIVLVASASFLQVMGSEVQPVTRPFAFGFTFTICQALTTTPTYPIWKLGMVDSKPEKLKAA
jgi:hypothetical protein